MLDKKKGLISNRFAIRIFTLQKHLEDNHQEFWGEWIKQQNDGFEG
jgi:hypothetical protein